MASSASAFQAAVSEVLASETDDNEREWLTAIVGLVAADHEVLWTAVDMKAWLVYVIVRAFAPHVSWTSVFNGDVRETAGKVPSLARTLGVATSIEPLVARLQQTQWPTQALAVLREVIEHIEDPRVRQHAIHFAYGVVQTSVAFVPTDEWLDEASRVLLLGITDVWSAVRKPSARAAAEIVLQFPTLARIDAFIGTLLKIASGDDWKAQEGALLTLTALVAAIQTDTAAAVTAPASRAADMIRGGASTTVLYRVGTRHRSVAQLPRNLTLKLKPTLYAALKHAQLSVRDAAAQCFVQYLERGDDATRVLTFQEVMSKLNRLTPAGEDTTTDIELLDAAEAEGLLDVLAKLVPHVPMAFLVKHWKVVRPTLERYVMHIASTVRLRSSAVVLALAERARETTPQSIELLYHMAVALAEPLVDSSVCWQRLEGRLLSVELLVGLIGKDRLWRMSLLGNGSSRIFDVWLPETMVPPATWSLDEDEERHLAQACGKTDPSIVERLEMYVESKKQTPEAFWQHVLGGWLRQTHEAFQSTQFELRRIGRQVLPGLIRLSLWCRQLPLIDATASAEAKSSRRLDAWVWTSLRHAVFHTQFVSECTSDVTWTGDADSFVVETLKHASVMVSSSDDEPEAVVARIEAILLANLRHPDPTNAAAVTVAFRDIHAHLPAAFQLAAASSSPDGSVDRQLSIALVPLMPVIVQRLVQGHDMWRLVERTILSWLSTDDMFRWITIDKRTAQALLLTALRDLVASDEVETCLAGDEVAFVLRTLEAAVPLPSTALKDAAADALVCIYASLWRVAAAPTVAPRLQHKIIMSLAVLHQQRCVVVDVKASSATKSEWDDWDGDGDATDEVRPSAPSDDASAPRGIVPLVRHVLSEDQVGELAQTLSRILNDKVSSALESFAQALNCTEH